jgi:hypothetical protein
MNPIVMEIVFPDGITETPYFGDYVGYVYKADTGVDDYPLGVQTAINAYYYTNWISFDDICDQKGTLSFYLYYQIATSRITLVYSYDFNTGDTYSQIINLAGTGSTWGSVNWGAFNWGQSGGLIQRVDVTGRGRLIRLGFKNSNLSETFQLDGIGTLTYLDTHI